MKGWLPIDLLQLSSARPAGALPKPAPSLIERTRLHGPIDPVVVRPIAAGRYEILSNPETWLAAGLVGRHAVPVLVRDDLTDDETAAIVRDQYSGTPNTAIEEARQFREQLQSLGGTRRRGAITELAYRVGRCRSYVAHSLRLLELPADVQELIRRGKLGAGHARPLVTLHDPALQRRLAKTIVDRGLSVREAELLAREHRGGTKVTAARPSIKPPALPTSDLRRLETQVSELIGCPFQIDAATGRATIQYFGDLEILQGVLDRLGYREQ